jgi:thioredoxin reductase/ferredoxin
MLANTILIAATVAFGAYYLRRHLRSEGNSLAVRDTARSAGLIEPASLHPLIDPDLCAGCANCVAACPEKDVLGLIDGRAELIEPTHCIGHGACKTACPTEAITLVFGTEKRGVDIPLVRSNFETNVPGIFIAGELGGMGLIRNAIEQGKQAIDSVAKMNGRDGEKLLDVVVIGAGPAGFSASLAAMQNKLRCVTVEQDSLGGTVSHYPRGKLVMTAPVKLPIVGKANFTETTKEKLLEFWQKAERDTGVKINYRERLEDVKPNGRGFVVTTTKGSYHTRTVLLTIGRRGTPRKLGTPGEDHPKVVYRLIDPEQYRGQHVLVVGGGDSALEAAISIAELPETTVALSYRSAAFSRAKEKNRQWIREAEQAGRLRVLLSSNVKEIGPRHVCIEHAGQQLRLQNDAVIVCAGGILPTPFLKKIGIEVETKYGAA